MKKGLLFLVLSIISLSIFAQAPQRFSYQAVIREGNGNLKTSGNVSVRINILQGTSNGTSVYSETHPTVAVNSNGLITLLIGGGTVGTGTFNTINWGSNTYFLRAETDIAGTSNYTNAVSVTTQLLSVPYALNAANGLPSGGTNGQVLTIVNGVPTWQTPGAGGGSNVIYSNWFKLNTPDPASAWRDTTAFSAYGSRYAVKSVPTLATQDYIDKAVILSYVKFIVGTTRILEQQQLPATFEFPVTNPNGTTPPTVATIFQFNFYPTVNNIYYTFYNFIDSNNFSSTGLSNAEFRYIIIPGSTLAGRRASNSNFPSVDQLKKMKYEDVVNLLNIPADGSNQ